MTWHGYFAIEDLALSPAQRDPAVISTELTQHQFAERNTPVVVFSAGGTDYLRMALFGGSAASWDQSRTEALAYLAAHIEEWETDEDT
jgi:hypothetical protein